MERNFHSRWGELDLIAVKTHDEDFDNEVHFDETAHEMNANAMTLKGGGVHFVDVPATMTIPLYLVSAFKETAKHRNI